ncbi:MAG: hypothetical protein ACYSWQ_10350 [Planctomycetota bacterium]
MNRVLFKSLLGILLTSSSALAGPLPFDKSEYAARRTRFMAQISDGIAVIRGSLAGSQDNDFRYLCGVEVPRAILIVDGIRKESLLFYTTTENYLKGEGLSPDLARNPQKATGVENYYAADRFSSLLGQLGDLYPLQVGDIRTAGFEQERMGRSPDTSATVRQNSEGTFL